MTSAEIRWNHESLVLNWAGVFLLPWLLIDKNPFCSQVRSEEWWNRYDSASEYKERYKGVSRFSNEPIDTSVISLFGKPEKPKNPEQPEQL